MGKILGIDLGTTNSCMAVIEGGEATVRASRWPQAGEGSRRAIYRGGGGEG